MSHGSWRWAAAGGLVGLSVLGLYGARRRADARVDAEEHALLGAGMHGFFDPDGVEALPPPAQRWLRRAIAPGTPLARVVTLEEGGRLRLAVGAGWRPLRGTLRLAPPTGFAHRLRVGRGPLAWSGHEVYARGEGRVALWRGGLWPALEMAGADVTRAAAGRLVLGAVWVPGTLLPGPGVRWVGVDRHTAEVTVQVGGEAPTLRVTVDGEGRLVRAHVQRWRSRPEGGRLEPFGFDRVLREATFGGYTVPTHVLLGWSLGTPDAFLRQDLRVTGAHFG